MHTGFTIIEFVVVIILMSILAAVGGPRLFNSTNYEQRLYFDQVISLLNISEKYAVATGCDVQIAVSNSGGVNTFTATTRNLCVGYAATNSGVFGNNLLSLRQINLAMTSGTVNVPAQITISTTGLPFYFTALGQAQDSSSNKITNPTIGIGSHTVNIVGQTGYLNDND